MVNEAVKAALAQDAEDLAAFSERKSEKSLSFDTFVAVGAKTDRRRIVARIQTLSKNPRPQASEKLAGYTDRYRVRPGSYRIVYLIDDARREVTIFKIGHRKDVYR